MQKERQQKHEEIVSKLPAGAQYVIHKAEMHLDQHGHMVRSREGCNKKLHNQYLKYHKILLKGVPKEGE